MSAEQNKEKLGSREQLAVIIMGSPSDRDHSQRIAETLDKFEVRYDMRVASAHKTPEHLLAMIEEYRDLKKGIVFIAVAGRSNALGGFIDSNTAFPVISCPPYSEKFGGADIYSSLRMPSGVGVVTVLEPEGAAIAAIKIFSLSNQGLKAKYELFLAEAKRRIMDADSDLQRNYH